MSIVYIIDDDEQIADMLKFAIEATGLPVVIYTDAYEFCKTSVGQGDIILLDLNMPGFDGVEVIRTLASNKCQAKLVLMSGHDLGVLHSAEKLAQAHSLMVEASLTKPIELKKLRTILSEMAEDVPAAESHTSHMHLLPELHELREAILNKDFVLHFQPQINLSTGRISSAEALVRWEHKERGLIYPDLFIELAERHNLIGNLTEQVLDLAMMQCTKWRQNGLDIPVSVNISSENIKGLYLPEQLMDLLDKYQLPPESLVLEVTESALMGELVTSLDILTRLRMKGLSLSIDDFGTGYSSLSQLHKIPFTELKIDKSFVMSMETDNESRAIVKTCIMLGHELNMKVVAEGVESQWIQDDLLQLGCDVAQGYHISKPMPAHDFYEFCKNHL